MASRALAAARGQADRLYALIDQGLQGGSNVVASALLARVLPAAEFGKVGVMIGLYYIVQGFHRTTVVLPYLTERGDHAIDGRRYHSDWWWLSVGVIAALEVLIGAAAALAWGLGRLRPDWAWIVAPLLLALATAPALLLSEHARRWLYQTGGARTVAIASAGYAAAMIATAAILPRFWPTATGGAAAWVAAGLVSALIALAVLRPEAPRGAASLAAFARNRSFAAWQSLNIVPYSFYSGATVVVVIGMLFGPTGAAVFTAARTLTNPANSIVSAVDSTDKPRAARAMRDHGLDALKRSIGRTRRLLVIATGLYLGTIIVGAGPIADFAFHGRYHHIIGQVRLLALSFFLASLNQPSETLLIVLRADRIMMATRSATAVLTVLLLIGATRWGTLGMTVALVASQAANMLFLLIGERRAARQVEAHA